MIIKYNNPLSACDFKFASDSTTGEFTGYGSVFDSVDNSGDTIRKGAFKDAIGKSLPKMFINHDHMDIPVGDWLSASEDSHGLLLEGKVDMNHHLGPSALSAMKRKAMEGLSIGALRSTLQFTANDTGGRDITKADLKEVSIVTFPMEERALIIDVKHDITSIRDVERILRDSGMFTRSMATAIVSQFKQVCQSESDAGLRDENTMLKALIADYERRLGVQSLTEKLVSAIQNR